MSDILPVQSSGEAFQPPQVSENLTGEIIHFIKLTKELDYVKANDASYLKSVAEATLSLHNAAQQSLQVAKKEMTMQEENLLDAGKIITTILTQPLSLPDETKDISMLSAALEFETKNATSTPLCKMLHQFLDYPAPVDRFLQELDLISQDLQKKP